MTTQHLEIQETHLGANEAAIDRFLDTVATEAGMSKQQQLWMRTHCEARQLKKRMPLYRQETSSGELIFIASGAITLRRETAYGTQIIALLTEGQCYSWKHHVPEDGTATCSAVSSEDATLVTISRDNLELLAETVPAFSRFLNTYYTQAVNFLESRLETFQLLDAHQRYEKLAGEQPELLSRFSLVNIANYLGIQPETLSRIRNPLYNKAS